MAAFPRPPPGNPPNHMSFHGRPPPPHFGEAPPLPVAPPLVSYKMEPLGVSDQSALGPPHQFPQWLQQHHPGPHMQQQAHGVLMQAGVNKARGAQPAGGGGRFAGQGGRGRGAKFPRTDDRGYEQQGSEAMGRYYKRSFSEDPWASLMQPLDTQHSAASSPQQQEPRQPRQPVQQVIQQGALDVAISSIIETTTVGVDSGANVAASQPGVGVDPGLETQATPSRKMKLPQPSILPADLDDDGDDADEGGGAVQYIHVAQVQATILPQPPLQDP